MKVNFEHEVPCSPEAVRGCLLTRAFWDEFLRGGNAIDPEVEFLEGQDAAHVRWKVAIPSDVPRIVTMLVGSRIRLDLRMPLKHGEEWRLDIDAHARRSAHLRSNFFIELDGDGSRFRLDGSFKVDTHVMRGTAEHEGWKEVVEPLLREELVPLLSRCCTGGVGAPDAGVGGGDV